MLGSLAAVIGAIAFVSTWAFYATFYARFGLSPDEVGLGFDAIGARAAFLLLPFWGTVAAMAALRVAGPHAWRPYLRTSVVFAIGVAVYCVYVWIVMGRSLLNAGAYSAVPGACAMVLVFGAWVAGSREELASPTSRHVVNWILGTIAIIALAFATYGRAEAAANLVHDVFQVRVVTFPDIEVLSVRAASVYPSGSTEEDGFRTWLGSSANPREDGATFTETVSKSSIVDGLLRDQTCVLLLGAANGVAHLWIPGPSGMDLGTPLGTRLTIPLQDVILSPDGVRNDSRKCRRGGDRSLIDLDTAVIG
jgi:hypothetical protein